MEIKITRKTKLKDIAPIFDAFPEALTAARRQWRHCLPGFDFFSLTIKELLLLQKNVYPDSLTRPIRKKNATVIKFLETVNAVEAGLRKFRRAVESTTPPVSMRERSAAAGLLEYTPEEAILLSVRDFYDLPNLEACHDLTLYEYILARKAKYNDIKFQKKLNELMR